MRCATKPYLRLDVMHYASPLVDDMLALLYSHPQVYVDVAQNDWGSLRPHFYAHLQRLVNAGFGERIMFGSDQMVWPSTIAVALQTIERAPFLSARQKRAILYVNAAHFLRVGASKQGEAATRNLILRCGSQRLQGWRPCSLRLLAASY